LCPNLLSRGVPYCEACAPFVKAAIRRYDQERDKGEQRQFLHSTIWRAVREGKLRADPLCERHKAQGKDVAATLVHHRDRDQWNTIPENLESMCFECHEQEHKAERFGRK